MKSQRSVPRVRLAKDMTSTQWKAAFGGVRQSSRYSPDLGGSMLMTNANRDRPFSKIPTRAGNPYYGKRTGFTDSKDADLKELAPKACPSVDSVSRQRVRDRLRAVKSELKEERKRRKAAQASKNELLARLDRTIEAQNERVRHPASDTNGATMPAPKGMRNGQPYYGRVWCAENRKQEVERLRPARHQGVDSMFTVLHKS